MDHVTNEAVDGLIASQLNGRMTRRQLATGVLALPAVTALIAACGSDKKSTISTAGTTAGGTTPVASDTTLGGTASSAATQTSAATATTGGTLRVAAQAPAKTLDPIAMQDLGAYGVVAQCFEYLCGLADDHDIGPGLATEWTPNADSTVWTFKLRSGVKWQNGADFTADDVVATMERIVSAGDKLGGSLKTGSAVAKDATTVVYTLDSPNASLPYLVSIYNPQSAITPKDWAAGTTLDAQPDGTGPWKLTKYDPTTGATFARHDAWWGGKTPLDEIDWQFFTDSSSMVTAMQSGSVDAIVQFPVIGGDALLNDSNFETIALRTTTHREIWMNCSTGQFTDKRVRQALALCIDRPALIETLFAGKADLGNDNVIAPVYPFYSDKVPQRARDTAKAKQLLADAGFPNGLKATLHAVDLQEIPQLAELLQIQAAEGGFTLDLAVESDATFYSSQWCPSSPCAGSAELGIVDYGHRATPDVFLLKAFKTGGDWNSSAYSSPALDAAILEYQASAQVDKRKAACEKIETIMTEDTPAAIPYFYNYLGGFSKKFTGVRLSALGQMLLDRAATA
ncbi:MAG: peptide/nickel transport system substrate-binding protein [Ilumatobacteraceae bacterium]|jgi:peptide/nickel transport system substrate-binding protein